MRHNPEFVARKVGSEIVLVPVTRAASQMDSLFTLNEVGARIWELVGNGDTQEQIAATLCREYEVEMAEALTDVAELLGQLRQIGAVMD